MAAPIAIAIEAHGGEACLVAFRALALAADRSVQLRSRLVDFVEQRGGSSVAFFDLNRTDRPAGRTRVVTFHFEPSERYLDLMSALAADGYVVDSHGGWPILSVVGDTATVTEGEVADKRLPGGPPA